MNPKRVKKISALAITLFIHGALVLFFILMVFHNPDPPLFADQSGVEVNFGLSDDGMGDVQPEPMTAPEVNQKSVTKPVTKEVPQKENILTQQNEETNVTAKEEIKPVKEPIKPIIKETPKEEVKQPVVNQNALYKGKKNTATNTGNEGETGKPGDQGIKEGSLYSKVHGKVNGSGDSGEGAGSNGKGISFSLAGRRMMKSPEIVDKSQESGKVVVTITVDKYGNVTKAIPGARGSTTTSSILYAKAQQAAMRAKFDALPNAEEEQRGSITFVFILQ